MRPVSHGGSIAPAQRLVPPRTRGKAWSTCTSPAGPHGRVKKNREGIAHPFCFGAVTDSWGNIARRTADWQLVGACPSPTAGSARLATSSNKTINRLACTHAHPLEPPTTMGETHGGFLRSFRLVLAGRRPEAGSRRSDPPAWGLSRMAAAAFAHVDNTVERPVPISRPVNLLTSGRGGGQNGPAVRALSSENCAE